MTSLDSVLVGREIVEMPRPRSSPAFNPLGTRRAPTLDGYRAASGRWIATGDSARMNRFDWAALVASVRLGDFAIPITARMDYEVAEDALLFTFSFRTKDVKGGFPTTIANRRRLACGDAFSMSRGQADDFLRREIRDIVLHELAEFLTIGGRREDPHADENRFP